jgi:gamma-glutamyltranspeptidase/glutathione hydrolase
MGRIWNRRIGLLGAAGLTLGLALTAGDPAGADEVARPPAQHVPTHHMIVTSNRLATAAGLAILREGGSAVDAAVAAAMVLAVVRPDQSGLGGGGVMLHFDAATHRVTVWDGRETAPAAASPDLFLDGSGTSLGAEAYGPGGRAVGAPGLLRMLDAAQRRHGRLPWERLFAAAIALAQTGAPVSPALAAAIAAETARLARQPAARAALLRPDGTALASGSVLRDTGLADTLRAIAAGRSDALLSGAIAAEIATTVRTDANPGLLTVDDLAAAVAIERAPLCLPYRGHLVCSAGPPSSGGLAVLETLGLLANTAFAAVAPVGAQPIGLAGAHILAESERLAQADAAFYLADPAFVRAPLAGLLAPDYLAGRARLIDPFRALPVVIPGTPSWDEPELRAAPSVDRQHGTSSLVVVDDAGNAVSLGASVQDRFGSGLMVRGFLLNDALTAFSTLPEREGRKVANQVEPGKRPLTAIAPVIVLDAQGGLEFVLGATGGDRIGPAVTQTLAETLDFRRTPRVALADPRIGASGEVVELEAATPVAALAPALQAMGHLTETLPAPGGLALIHASRSGLAGAADPRDAEADSAGD